MAIQVRRGNESDFDASKMLPGEWAVSLDTKYVRMCFAPGVVLRMSTYEAFEADVSQIKAILEECRTIEAAIRRIQTEVNSKASLTVEYANSAKESADRAYTEAERAKTYADNAEAVTGVQIATQERAGLIKGGDNYIAEDGTLVLIKETASTTLPNSHAGRFKFDEIGGVMEQDSTAGNQLFDKSKTTANKALNYATGGVITADGYFITDYIEVSPNTAYTKQNFTTGQEHWAYDENKNPIAGLGKNNTFTTPNNTKYVVLSGLTTNINIAMLNAGTTALPYEPYTGGQPAPNPSYPMEIKKTVVSGVKTHGKNMIKYPYPDVSKTVNGITFTDNGDGSVTVNGTATAMATFAFATTQFYELEVTHLKVSNGIGYGTDKPIIQADIYCDGVYKSTIQTSDENNSKREYAGKITLGVCRIKIDSGVTINNVTVYPMICDADITDDSYEPYTESSITFSQPIELYGKDDEQDVITPKEINREYGEIVLNSSSGWARQASGYFYCPLHDAKKVYTSAEPYFALCDSYKFVAKDGMKLSNGECTMYKDANRQYPNQNWFYICDTSCTTTEELNAKLDASPIKLVYPLRTPTTEALPIADQIALNSLATYDGITYVEFDSEIQPTFKGEYGTSKVGGYTLESLLTARNNDLRITAVESAVVNNL